MEIKNFDSIVTEGKEKLDNIFEVFSKDIKAMASTKQLNINNLEESMLIFMNSVKTTITDTSGIFLSNIETENTSKRIKYKGEELKLLKKSQNNNSDSFR